jgi:hypothetical protein
MNPNLADLARETKNPEVSDTEKRPHKETAEEEKIEATIRRLLENLPEQINIAPPKDRIVGYIYPWEMDDYKGPIIRREEYN